MTDLDQFLQWAKSRGHYPAIWMVENFRKWQKCPDRVRTCPKEERPA